MELSLCLVGSTAGRFGERGHIAYAASKSGLHGLMRTLKNEIVMYIYAYSRSPEIQVCEVKARGL